MQPQWTNPFPSNRCLIARLYGLNPGTLKSPNAKQCQQCSHFDKGKETILTIEKTLQYRTTDTRMIGFLENPSDPKNKIKLSNFLSKTCPTACKAHKPNAKRHIAPKVESRIANDLLIATRCGAIHNGIDQPLSDSLRSEIRRQSTELCACPRWTDSNRNALKYLTQMIEQHEQRCGERTALLSEWTSDMTHNQKRLATDDMNALANFEFEVVDRHNDNYTIRPGDNFREEPPAPHAPTTLPQFCKKCDRLIPLSTVKKPGAYICCNVEDLIITLSNTRVCQACQLKWLLKFNTHQARTNSLIKQIRESGLSELVGNNGHH